MAYQVKYRAKGVTTRQSKNIRVDILYDNYNINTGWVNTGYETFTSSGNDITSAINTSGSGYCDSDHFNVRDGESIWVDISNFVLNSGQEPTIVVKRSTLSSEVSNKENIENGANSICLDCTYTGEVEIRIENTAASNWDSNGDIFVFRGLTFGSNPVVISQTIPDDPFDGGIQGSECRLQLISETDLQFSEFFTCTERDYLVKVFFDGTEVWHGFIAPEMYEEPYVYPPYQVELIAYDGLGDLKNVEWTDLAPFSLSFRGFIEDALGTLDEYYPNWYDYVFNATTGLDYPDHTSTSDNVKFDLGRFISDSIGSYSSMYDILDAICKCTNSRFIMDRGYYRWFRVLGLRDDDHYYTYWAKGAGTSTGDENNKKNISAATPNTFIGGSQRLSIFPALREFDISHDYNYRNLVFKDYSFEQADPTTYWEDVGSFGLSTSNRVGREMEYAHERTVYEYKEVKRVAQNWEVSGRDRAVYLPVPREVGVYKYVAGNYCLDMGSGDTTPANILASDAVHYIETFTLQNTAAANYSLAVKWDQKVHFTTDAETTLYIRAYNASDDKWMDEFGAWVAGPDAIGIDIPTTDSLQWKTYKIQSAELNTAYEYTIHVYLSSASTAAGSVSGTWFDNIEVNVVRLDTDAMAMSNDLSEAINTNYNLYLRFPDRMLGDIVEQGYEDTIYKGWLKASDGAAGHELSDEWQVGGSRAQKMLEHSRDLHKCVRETPLYKLNATFYGDNNFMTVYTDTNLSKNFFTNYATWNLKEMTWEGEFIELPEATVESTNLITSWTNDGVDPYDTFSSTGAVVDSAIETTGNIGEAGTNSIAHDDDEEFYLTWDFTLNSGDYPIIYFGGDSVQTAAESGNTTLTATSTASDDLDLYTENGNVTNISNATICLYRKYGW
jgi:hypothetical protein